MTAVELREVRRTVNGVHLLDDVSMTIADGEFVSIVGPTGCGKTTLLRIIAGLDPLASGDLLFDGVRVNTMRTGQRNVGMVSQEYALYPHLNVYENIAFPLRQSKELRREALDDRVREIAAQLSLTDVLAKRSAAIAGGERQRVALGRALIRRPGVLLLDEPLSNIDAFLRPGMIRELSAIQRRVGVTVVYVTHDQFDALRLGQRVAVMDQGRLQQVAPARELLDNPVNLFVAGFVGTPPMSFVAARLIGDLVHLPFGLFRLPSERLSRVRGGGSFVAGVRPFYAGDDEVIDPAGDDLIEITSDAMPVPGDMIEFERDLAGLAPTAHLGSVQGQLVASLHAEGLMPPGRSSRVYVDTRRIHLFDPVSGENLTLPPG